MITKLYIASVVGSLVSTGISLSLKALGFKKSKTDEQLKEELVETCRDIGMTERGIENLIKGTEDRGWVDRIVSNVIISFIPLLNLINIYSAVTTSIDRLNNGRK